MERIKIKGTDKTPTVLFDGNKGIFKIEGKAIHENSAEFFKELIDGVDSYKKDPVEVLNVLIDLEYFNTSSARNIMFLFKKLQEVECVITWVYEAGDTDMLEAGEDYEDMVKTIKFKFVEKPEER